LWLKSGDAATSSSRNPIYLSGVDDRHRGNKDPLRPITQRFVKPLDIQTKKDEEPLYSVILVTFALMPF
jgi:hypothetical protein